MKNLKKITALLILSLIITSVHAQDVTEVRKVSGFTGISVGESIEVELTYGDKEFVEVTAGEDYIDRIKTEVKGENLKIHIDGNNWSGWNNKVLVKVTMSSVKSLKASSSSSVVSQNLIESEDIRISVSSSALIKLALKSANTECKASSSGKIRLKGATQYFDVHASSSAKVDADEFKATNVKASASSSGRIVVNTKEELVASASSSGSIKYNGSPEKLDVNVSSSGKVSKAN